MSPSPPVLQEVQVLIDWQNCVREVKVWDAASASQAVDLVADLVTESLTAFATPPRHANVRLYGSWSSEPFSWRPTKAADLLSQAIGRSTKRVGRTAMIFDLAQGLAFADEVPDPVLMCAYVRSSECRRSDCTNRVQEQKLADAMIVADAGFYGSFPDVGVVVVSDDFDMVPGLMMCSYLRRAYGGRPSQSVVWFRPGHRTSSHDQRFEKHFRVVGKAKL